MFYYAKLNENQICTSIETRARELPKDLDGFIKIPDYNETLLWRKWLGDQWSQETYEPSVDTVIQDKLTALETENTTLKNNIQALSAENTDLKTRVADLEEVIASLVGGAM